jgi:hypothetical protein
MVYAVQTERDGHSTTKPLLSCTPLCSTHSTNSQYLTSTTLKMSKVSSDPPMRSDTPEMGSGITTRPRTPPTTSPTAPTDVLPFIEAPAKGDVKAHIRWWRQLAAANPTLDVCQICCEPGHHALRCERYVRYSFRCLSTSLIKLIYQCSCTSTTQRNGELFCSTTHCAHLQRSRGSFGFTSSLWLWPYCTFSPV